MVSGIVSITLYPLAAPAEASPIPVFPLVGSIMTVPFLRRPFSSASFIMAFAILSFTLPAGLKYSSFARSVAFMPNSSVRFESSTIGVFPTRSFILLYFFIFDSFSKKGHYLQNLLT